MRQWTEPEQGTGKWEEKPLLPLYPHVVHPALRQTKQSDNAVIAYCELVRLQSFHPSKNLVK